MKIRINQSFEKEAFHPKRCFLGLDEVDFSQEFGWSTEFIGHLKPLPMDGENVFLFYLEKVTREGNSGTWHVMNHNNTEEYNFIQRSLLQDYQIEKENIEVL